MNQFLCARMAKKSLRIDPNVVIGWLELCRVEKSKEQRFFGFSKNRGFLLGIMRHTAKYEVPMKTFLAESSVSSGFSLSRSNGTVAFYRLIRLRDSANVYGINTTSEIKRLTPFTIQTGCFKKLLMPEFSISDKRHLEAAEGWLGLGSWQEAHEELENLTPQLRGHPEVLGVRFQIYAKAEKWEYAIEMARAISDLMPDIPFGHFHLAFGLHELKKTKEAYQVLIAVVDKFPSEHLIRYNLACYSCRLGNLKEAYQWLEKAIDVAGKEDVRQTALDDPDLEELWSQIAEI